MEEHELRNTSSRYALKESNEGPVIKVLVLELWILGPYYVFNISKSTISIQKKWKTRLEAVGKNQFRQNDKYMR
jgi:hypothetical protein